MEFIRLQAPPDATSVSFEGVEYFVQDGVIEAPKELEPLLCGSMGFSKLPPPPPPEEAPPDTTEPEVTPTLTPEVIAKMGRKALIAYCENNELASTGTIDVMRARVYEHAQEKKQ